MKQNSKKVDEADFLYRSTEAFLDKLIIITRGKIIYNSKKETGGAGYTWFRSLKGIECGSVSGGKIDYFFMDCRKAPAQVNLFSIGRFSPLRVTAGSLLSQGFDYCGTKDGIVHFQKDALTVRLSYTNWGRRLEAVEVTGKDMDSQIREKTKSRREKSLESLIRMRQKKMQKILYSFCSRN